jgi:NH3-dependent NAD+ synthetase
MRFGEALDYINSKVGMAKTGIIDSVQKQGYDGVVFEMDGRLYTSVVAKLCKDAIGNHVKAIIMPNKSTSKHDDMSDAIDLASEWGIKYTVKDISYVMNEITRGFPILDVEHVSDLGEYVKLACLFNEGNRLNYAMAGINTGNVDSIRYSYQSMPLENILPEYIEGMGSILGVPDHIITK